MDGQCYDSSVSYVTAVHWELRWTALWQQRKVTSLLCTDRFGGQSYDSSLNYNTTVYIHIFFNYANQSCSFSPIIRTLPRLRRFVSPRRSVVRSPEHSMRILWWTGWNLYSASDFPCQYHFTSVPYYIFHLPQTLSNVSNWQRQWVADWSCCSIQSLGAVGLNNYNCASRSI